MRWHRSVGAYSKRRPEANPPSTNAPLAAAVNELRPGDVLTVIEIDRLSRNLLEGLLTLNELFQRGVAVKIHGGVAVGEHTERSFLLDLALALAEDRRRAIPGKPKTDWPQLHAADAKAVVRQK